MHPRSSSSAATVFLFTALAVIGAVGIFGIPQFAPIVASPSDELGFDDLEAITASSNEGGEFGVGEGAAQGIDDLFAPLPDDRTPGASAGNGQTSLDSGGLPDAPASPPKGVAFTDHSGRSAPLGGRPLPSKTRTVRPSPLALAGRRSDHRGSSPTAQPEQSAADALTWRAAVARLNELGIDRYRLSAGEQPNAFYFCCWYAPTSNPRVIYRFEAEADGPLKAVQDVLEQIDAWHKTAYGAGIEDRDAAGGPNP